jgi:succinylarginine dihydrolase
MTAGEINFDGLVGPTHNYAGLASGNIASLRNKGKESNPRAAALQGLAKMRFLSDLGVRQAVLPPHPRPDVDALRRLGFSGGDAQVLRAAHAQAPAILAACSSASAMWTANAATVSPSADTLDGRVHITPANLLSQFHRSLEAPTTARVLKRIFSDESLFVHHPPLPAAWPLTDEGAANQMRVAAAGGLAGVEIFVYGRREKKRSLRGGGNPARQSLAASRSVAAGHRLRDSALFVRQSPQAIGAGAFHNDVVAVANLNVLLYHSRAWESPGEIVGRIRKRLSRRGGELAAIEVSGRDVPLGDAIDSYLFNSQMVTLPDGSMALIAPRECLQTPSARRFLEWLPTAGTPIRKVYFVQVRQSMRNGGGPACLRLSMMLTDRESAAVHRGVLFTDALEKRLTQWIHRHYRDSLFPAELADPKLLEESRRALDELTGILGLGSVYDFQKS